MIDQNPQQRAVERRNRILRSLERSPAISTDDQLTTSPADDADLTRFGYRQQSTGT